MTGPLPQPPHVTSDTTNAFSVLAAEEVHGDQQATEALILTFNADLGFFEARLLGLLRATGARVTVLADARVWAPDIRAIRHAGRTYHLGLVDSPAAFHPKLTLITGHTRAVATVGSGNLTMGGWQYNAELLTTFTGDRSHMPRAFTDLYDSLVVLADDPGLDPLATKAIRRTLATLGGLLRTAERIDTGHRIHSSWQGPLIDHLPIGPVDELCLSAAFHDPASAATAALLERLRPRRVRVAVQPGWTHLDPARLDHVLNRHADRHDAATEILTDPNSADTDYPRYRHGKLIEWTTLTGERFALTGSPNLSQVALLHGTSTGGNHELAVVAPLTTTLFPGGAVSAANSIPTLLSRPETPVDDTATASPIVRVLLAERNPETGSTDVLLNGPAAAHAHIEVSLFSESPDRWSHLANIPEGQRTLSAQVDILAGSRIRAVTIDATGRRPHTTEPVYVTDTERILRQQIANKTASRTQRSVATDLLGADMTVLDNLRADFIDFARDLKNLQPPPKPREAPATVNPADRTRDAEIAEPWLWLQDETIRRHGKHIASWLLALPRLGQGDGSGEVAWTDKIKEDTEVGLETDDTESATEEVTEQQPEPVERVDVDHRHDSDRLRLARRKWVAAAVELVPDLPPASRLLVLRLTLAFWSAGNWPDEADPEPFRHAAELLQSLGLSSAGTQPAEELQARIGALAAITLTVMRQRADPTRHDDRFLINRDAADVARPLVGDLSDDVVGHYVVGLTTGHGAPLTVDHVLHAISDLTADDPLAPVRAHLDSRGHTVTQPARNQIHIEGTFSTPEQIALDAMAHAEEADGTAIWASNDRGHWTLVVWRKPDLVTISHRANTRWRHQRLRLMGPAAVARAFKNGGPNDLPDVQRPKRVSTPAAQAVLNSVGITDPQPPESTQSN